VHINPLDRYRTLRMNLHHILIANHSQIHHWFTYRAQLVSLMEGFAFLTDIVRSNLETSRRPHERDHLEKVHSSAEMPLAPPR